MVAEKYLRGVRTGACTPLAHIVLMKRGCKLCVTPAALPIRQHDNTMALLQVRVALSLAREPRFANTSEKALGSKGTSFNMRGTAHFYALMACPGTSIEIASTTFCRITEDDESFQTPIHIPRASQRRLQPRVLEL
jgi:hypothetical protein